eukprot:gene10732-288_t
MQPDQAGQVICSTEIGQGPSVYGLNGGHLLIVTTPEVQVSTPCHTLAQELQGIETHPARGRTATDLLASSLMNAASAGLATTILLSSPLALKWVAVRQVERGNPRDTEFGSMHEGPQLGKPICLLIAFQSILSIAILQLDIGFDPEYLHTSHEPLPLPQLQDDEGMDFLVRGAPLNHLHNLHHQTGQTGYSAASQSIPVDILIHRHQDPLQPSRTTL